MTNATFGANAPAMPNRRAALGSLLSAAAALTVLSSAIAAPGSDARLFVLVEAGKHWFDKMDRLCSLCDSVRAKDEGRSVLPEDEAMLDEAQDNYCAALEEALSISPQTVPGARALLEWVQRDSVGVGMNDDHIETLLESLLRSPLLAGEGPPGPSYAGPPGPL